MTRAVQKTQIVARSLHKQTGALAFSIGFFEGTALNKTFAGIGTEGSCSRRATSIADCGRLAVSFCKHAATTSSQIAGTDAGSMSRSLRRSVIDGGTLSWICRSMLPA
jgi:hypothetical protein